jgi:hypothetical protein
MSSPDANETFFKSSFARAEEFLIAIGLRKRRRDVVLYNLPGC